jgi:Ca2+-binding RTX toxin-like protein
MYPYTMRHGKASTIEEAQEEVAMLTWRLFIWPTVARNYAVGNAVHLGMKGKIGVSALLSAFVVLGWVAPAARGGSSCDIEGTPGRDVLRGTSGTDVICGHRGRDRIYGLGGRDFLIGGQDRDRIFGGKGDDEIQGGWGRDWLYGRRGGDQLHGSRQADLLVGNSGADCLDGRDHNPRDRIFAGSGFDTAIADEGDLVRAAETHGGGNAACFG